MLCRDLVAGVLLAGTVSACAAVDSTVAPRHDTVSRSIAQGAQRIHSSQHRAGEPRLSAELFDHQQVIPQMTNTTTVGMPSFLEGPNPQCINTSGGAVGATGIAGCLTPPGTPGRDIIFGNTNNLTDAIAVQTPVQPVYARNQRLLQRPAASGRSCTRSEFLHPAGILARAFVLAVHGLGRGDDRKEHHRLPVQSAL